MNAIYAGSFDPFTNGHLDIVKQASNIFDTTYVIIACNIEKHRHYNVNQIQNAINNILVKHNINNVFCRISNNLISDEAKVLDCEYLVRGLRNPSDYNYEENIAKINREINPNLKTIYFRADNDIISSSFVREIFRHNKNISKYVDKSIIKIMEDKNEN